MIGTDVAARAARDLVVENVRVRFGGLTALSDVSVASAPGQVSGIIGPNGAGKTTLFNVICGFITPDKGTISWGGRAYRPIPRSLAGNGISRTVQAVGLCQSLTVLENVKLGADVRRDAGLFSALAGLPTEHRSERRLRAIAMECLERVDAVHLAHLPPQELPYPEMKRVALARALAGDPDLLLLDEPAGGLGHGDIEGLARFIRDFVKDGRRSVMLVEHHMDLVMDVCDHVFVLDFGKIVAEGSPSVISNSQAVAEAYLGVAAPDVSAVSIAGES